MPHFLVANCLHKKYKKTKINTTLHVCQTLSQHCSLGLIFFFLSVVKVSYPHVSHILFIIDELPMQWFMHVTIETLKGATHNTTVYRMFLLGTLK